MDNKLTTTPDPRATELLGAEPMEVIKVNIEYVQRLTTLSTGSVLLITAFLEKLFSNPQWKGCLIVSLVCFSLSVVASVLADSLLVAASSSPKANIWRGWTVSIFGTLFLSGTLGGFLIGIVALMIFAIKNVLNLPLTTP
jgi:hypothetical protein